MLIPRIQWQIKACKVVESKVKRWSMTLITVCLSHHSMPSCYLEPSFEISLWQHNQAIRHIFFRHENKNCHARAFCVEWRALLTWYSFTNSWGFEQLDGIICYANIYTRLLAWQACSSNTPSIPTILVGRGSWWIGGKKYVTRGAQMAQGNWEGQP